MNLRTACLICEGFLALNDEDGLMGKLADLLSAGDTLTSGADEESMADKRTALGEVAKKALAAYDGSVFADQALRVFPEFAQLGAASIMGEDFRAGLATLANSADQDGDMDHQSIESALSLIASEGEGMTEMTEQMEKLLSVARYFGVERRENFDAEAIAVIKMPGGEGETHAGGNVDSFIDRLQAFQSIVDFCRDEDSDIATNLRMISGDDETIMVADLSAQGATVLQKIVTDVTTAKADIVEIEDASGRLAQIGVNEKIIEMLSQETTLIRGFEKEKAGAFLLSLLGGEKAVTAKWVASAIMGLMDDGVAIECVLIPNKGFGPTAADAPNTEVLEKTDDSETPEPTEAAPGAPLDVIAEPNPSPVDDAVTTEEKHAVTESAETEEDMGSVQDTMDAAKSTIEALVDRGSDTTVDDVKEDAPAVIATAVTTATQSAGDTVETVVTTVAVEEDKEAVEETHAEQSDSMNGTSEHGGVEAEEATPERTIPPESKEDSKKPTTNIQADAQEAIESARKAQSNLRSIW
ncbi:MAG: hypothetical protein AAFY09_14505, partial [Pseudomonadota bacterium]